MRDDNLTRIDKYQAHPSIAGLVTDMGLGRSKQTMKGYTYDLRAFARWLGVKGPAEAAQVLIASGHGEANRIAARFREALIERNLASATVNRKLATLRALVATAKVFGLTSWTLSVRSVRRGQGRNMSGPSPETFRGVLDYAAGQGEPRRSRDVALLRLLYGVALRRGEVSALLLSDVDLYAGLLYVLGKGRHDRECLTLPMKVTDSLATWLRVRGKEPGPLFYRVDRWGRMQPGLSGSGIYHVVRDLGRQVGITLRPHGIRHLAVTEACNKTNQGLTLEEVMRFSRHRNLATLSGYWDSRANSQAKVARLIDAAV